MAGKDAIWALLGKGAQLVVLLLGLSLVAKFFAFGALDSLVVTVTSDWLGLIVGLVLVSKAITELGLKFGQPEKLQ